MDVLSLEVPLGPILGEGTSGTVQPLAQDTFGRFVVKRIKKSEDKQVVTEEVRLLKLASAECPYVLRFAFAFETPTELLVITEACDLPLWDALVHAKEWQDQSLASTGLIERRCWSAGLCSAVCHCHSLRILHRDINPWNVLLVKESGIWSPRLGDFGLAVELQGEELQGTEATSDGVAALDDSAVGSLYSAPELGKRYGFPADVFSLGMTLVALWASASMDESQLIHLVEDTKQHRENASGDEPELPELQVDLEAHWALRRALSSKPWHRGVAHALLAAFQGDDFENLPLAKGARGSQQKLQRIWKRHTLQLNAVGMKALLEALDKGVTDAMIQSLFSALGTSRGTVEIDTFLQWLFQDQLA